ncbi:EF-hand domain-containing protein [Pseudoxanthomonas sp.]|uniref:EF-hand domain-containing protein n=1 Tax=Pseudoxanthomonas sp. TaxID=1871049 RepID=UPI002605B614|nr:EF-hand domain-containing protein [Pseudoxanthomonas sp.]WDS35077.1 MAG: EF-hand domain-containing protein [Pseudoxanthomonas sp.]
MKTGVLAGACLCTLLFPLAAAAQAPAASARPLIGGHGNNVEAFIAEFDDNGDGRVTWAEFEAFRRVRFDASDSNHDGTVDEAEYVAEFEARKAQELERERAAQLEQTRTRFAALDADKDGRISRAEFDATAEKTWQGGQRALADKGKAKSAYKPGEAKTGEAARRFDNAGNDRLGMPSSHTAEGFLVLYDGNGDGQVTRAEFDQARNAQFTRTDRDGDGALSQDEYLAEFEDRLDRRIATLNQGEDRQVHVRFGVLDTDKDGKMTFAEYQASGKRLFDTADRNHDGVVDAADARLPAPRRQP